MIGMEGDLVIWPGSHTDDLVPFEPVKNIHILHGKMIIKKSRKRRDDEMQEKGFSMLFFLKTCT